MERAPRRAYLDARCCKKTNALPTRLPGTCRARVGPLRARVRRLADSRLAPATRAVTSAWRRGVRRPHLSSAGAVARPRPRRRSARERGLSSCALAGSRPLLALGRPLAGSSPLRRAAQRTLGSSTRPAVEIAIDIRARSPRPGARSLHESGLALHAERAGAELDVTGDTLDAGQGPVCRCCACTNHSVCLSVLSEHHTRA
jgi:hypothetical protein